MKTLKWLCFALLICAIHNTVGQQIITDASPSLETLIQENLGQGCVEISNVTTSVNGQFSALNSFGSFQKGQSNFPFENGIVISTGSIESAGNGLNPNTLNEGSSNWLTDPDLEATLGISGTLNATSIEFDFISATNQISFNYILASEEYNANFPCEYSDGFAFLIRKVENTNYENIALIPGTNTPVNTNTIHDDIVGFCDAQNAEFFEGYNLGDTNFNGRTVVLTATTEITPYVPYKVKLIIADQNDKNYDSAVFIEGTSTIANLDLGPDIDTCAQSVALDGNIFNNLAEYQWYRNGNLIPGATNPQIQTTISGTYSLEVSIPISNTICTIEDEIQISLTSEQNVDDISDFILCDDTANDQIEIFDLTTRDSEILNALPVGNYEISYHLTSDGAQNGSDTITTPIPNLSNPQSIYVRVQDIDNGCLGYTSFDLIVNQSPSFELPDDINICDDSSADGATSIDLTDTTNMIVSQNPDFVVSYHTSLVDAESNQNAVGNPFTNLSNPETLYIRVQNQSTGCFSTTSIGITVLVNPDLNPSVQWIDACENDGDGFANFDLTSITEDVLQGLTGVSVVFFETESEAINNINPIQDPTAYENTTPAFQLVYIQVTNDTTGCVSIMPIELHSNLIDTGFETSGFGVCDDISNDGIADIDLNEVETWILNNYNDYEILFYESETDQLNNTNEINKDIAYTANTITTTLYFSAVSESCIQFGTIELTIHPAFEIQDLDTVEYCDTDFDGSTEINLSTFDDYISQGIDSPMVRYYRSLADATNNVNAITGGYINTNNPSIIYTRVTNTQTLCFDIAPLEVLVIDPPVVNQPSDIIVCDDDQDGFSVINLLNRTSEIVPDTTDLTFSFHTSFEDADTNTNPLPDPDSTNLNTKPIFVRVESLITTCHSIVVQNVVVNTLPVFQPISVFEACENDGDGFNEFLFIEKDNEILNGQIGKEVLYFETEQDAVNRTNSIDKTIPYGNLSNPQTIYVRVENTTDQNCFDTTSMEIQVTQFVSFNPPTDISICDDPSNDGFETVNLASKISEISNGISLDLGISFHASFNDADLGINPIGLTYTNTLNPQVLYARIENDILCPAIEAFSINIVQVPDINPAPDLINCDTDYDGITIFDLTQVETEVLDVRVDGIELSYHESMAGLETDSESINDPQNYINISNPQTVYLKVTNTQSNCYSYTTIDLSSNLPPEFNDFLTYDICFNPESSFNLNEIESVIVDDNNDVVLSYYSSVDNAENNSNPLDMDYNYTTNSDTIFTRIQSESSGCFYIYPFDLIVNPLPIANQPEPLEVCDDSSNDGVASFNLFSVDSQILGTQDPNIFSVNYFVNENNADQGINALNENFTGQDSQIIYSRIENNTTGCYALTQFELIVNEHPNIPSDMLDCDIDYDGLTTFDLTQAESELFLENDPDNVITYFETIEDLESNMNEIQNPSSYINISNPQTVYIRVFNTVANCYTYVPLYLDVILPPAIDARESFEVCETDAGEIQLSDINSELLIQNTNVAVSYFQTEQDAFNQTNALNNTYQYNTTADVIFARIEFSTTRCFHIHQFTLLINPLPLANPVENQEACDNDFDGTYPFDLNALNSETLGTQDPSDFLVSYHSDLQNAEEGIGTLESPYQASNGETIYIRVEHILTGCFDITSFETIVHRKPFVNIDDKIICLDDLPLEVSAETNISTDSYLWSTGATNPEIEISNTGIYSVTVTSENGCETISIFNVEESESALIQFTETIDFSDPNNIIVTISGIGDYLYQLDNMEPQTSNVFTNVSIGEHLVTVIDLNGCASASKVVTVVDVPKFMTPNGDGAFDTWHITGVESLQGTIIYIYDRYGKLLKTLTSETEGWNGYYNGSLMPASDYWFLAKVKRGNDSFEVKGHFALRY